MVCGSSMIQFNAMVQSFPIMLFAPWGGVILCSLGGGNTL